MPHDHRRGLEAADDPVVVVDDLGDAEPVQDGRVLAEGLDLALHARPGRREHLVSALLEARLPALPAARGEPEAVDEDDGRMRTHWKLLQAATRIAAASRIGCTVASGRETEM